MRPRHLPRHWLMTDERQGDGLWAALIALPPGSGVVFRHHATPTADRRRLFAQVMRVARRRRLTVVRAGPRALPGEAGVHNIARGPVHGIRTFAVHNGREVIAARRAGADLMFVSPVFATRSHPGARTLGVVRLGLLLRGIATPAVALGGLNARAFRRLRGLDLWGWAGIDAWSRNAAASAVAVRDRASSRPKRGAATAMPLTQC